MAVSVKMCIFNAIIFVILVQIVANSPYTSQQPMKHESSLSGKNFLVTLKSKERVFEKLCDGYVISPKSILAPAHCVYNFRNSSLFEKDQILVEYFHANGSINTPYLERKEVEYLSVPESFDVITMKDDIALLFLKEEIAKVKPLEINFDKNIENIYYLDDEDVIPTNLLTKETCGKFYRPVSILEGMMCVQDEEYNGSKAVFMNDKIVGFESWKNNVVDLTYPKVFSNLAIYNQWIHRELQSHGEKDYGLIGILCYALFTIWVAKRSIKPVEENSMGI